MHRRSRLVNESRQGPRDAEGLARCLAKETGQKTYRRTGLQRHFHASVALDSLTVPAADIYVRNAIKIALHYPNEAAFTGYTPRLCSKSVFAQSKCDSEAHHGLGQRVESLLEEPSTTRGHFARDR
jgi:hypothetical protein